MNAQMRARNETIVLATMLEKRLCHFVVFGYSVSNIVQVVGATSIQDAQSWYMGFRLVYPCICQNIRSQSQASVTRPLPRCLNNKTELSGPDYDWVLQARVAVIVVGVDGLGTSLTFARLSVSGEKCRTGLGLWMAFPRRCPRASSKSSTLNMHSSHGLDWQCSNTFFPSHPHVSSPASNPSPVD